MSAPSRSFPAFVLLAVDHRIEAQHGELVEHADRCVDLLYERVRGADADIGLTADDGLGGQVLGLQIGRLDIDAALGGAGHGDHEVDHLAARHIAKGDAHGALVLRRRGSGRQADGQRHGNSRAGPLQSVKTTHGFLPLSFEPILLRIAQVRMSAQAARPALETSRTVLVNWPIPSISQVITSPSRR